MHDVAARSLVMSDYEAVRVSLCGKQRAVKKILVNQLQVSGPWETEGVGTFLWWVDVHQPADPAQ